jgi:hypothetical protein
MFYISVIYMPPTEKRLQLRMRAPYIMNKIGDTMITADRPASRVDDQLMPRLLYMGPSNRGNVAAAMERTITWILIAETVFSR